MNTLAKQPSFNETAVIKETNLLEKDPLGFAALGTHPRWKIQDDKADEMLAALREEEITCHE